MYKTSRRSSFSGSRRSSFGGQRSFGGGSRGFSPRKKIKTFDPSLFVKQASGQAPEPYVSKTVFSDFALHETIQANIKARGYEQPTAIQEQAIPVLLAGKDVVGVANTGTGKTAAFLLPLIHRSVLDENLGTLIVTPTRELAVQIESEFRLFAKGLNRMSVLCIGGVGMGPQIQGLRQRPHFVIGTPGRIKDLEMRRHLDLSDYNAIVLDEVDQMLDMGFIHDVKHITSMLPEDRHSLFFSATLPESAQKIMKTFLRDPITISVKSHDSSANVEQNVIRTEGQPKIDILHNLLRQQGFDKVIVFGRTKHGTEKVARALIERGVAAGSIHGNKSQAQRQRAIEQFKRNKIQVLLATDVASRGLDIDNVTHVINYDLPETYEDYIHRIGRTGRANNTGFALTFVD